MLGRDPESGHRRGLWMPPGTVACHPPRSRSHAAMNADAVPQANFLNFLSGLGSQALMQLGEIPNPASGQREANIPFAKYSIELLHVLKEKTDGNRSDEESQYLESMLGDLDTRLAKALADSE